MRPPFTHLVFAVLVCAAAAVGYGFWYAAVGAESAAVAQIESDIVTKTETTAHIASARASLAEIAGDEATMRGYFVPETGIVSFINGLESAGQKQSAVVNVVSVSSGTVNSRPALTFVLTVKGSFDAVMRTVGVIEYAPYDLSITSLAVNKDSKVEWRADLTLLVGSSAVATSTKP